MPGKPKARKSPRRAPRSQHPERLSTFAEFAAGYSEEVRAIANGLRELILTAAPDSHEQVDAAGRLVAYNIAPGYGGTIAVLIFSKSEIKLGFYKGSELEDPAGLLEGKGKVHRHVPIRDSAAIQSKALSELLQQAVAKARKRNPVL